MQSEHSEKKYLQYHEFHSQSLLVNTVNMTPFEGTFGLYVS